MKFYGKNNPNYRHGRYIENRCANCGILIDPRSKNCHKCRAILNNSFKGRNHTTKSKLSIGKKSKLKFTDKYKMKIKMKHTGNKKRAINGYFLIKDYEHPNRNKNNDVLEHIKIMSEYIKRPIGIGEIIHHIDFNKQNNKIENLYLCNNRKEHSLVHFSISKLVEELLKRNYIKFENGRYMIGGGAA